MSMRSSVFMHIGGKFDPGKLEYLAELCSALNLGVSGQCGQRKEEMLKALQEHDLPVPVTMCGQEVDYSELQGLADDFMHHKIPFCMDLGPEEGGHGERWLWQGRFRHIRRWHMLDSGDNELLIDMARLLQFQRDGKTLRDVIMFLDQFEPTIPPFAVVNHPNRKGKKAIDTPQEV